MDRFVTKLSRCCTTYPTDAKWVFVPTHGVGWTLAGRFRPRRHELAQPAFRHAP
jgi:hypothetical protein